MTANMKPHPSTKTAIWVLGHFPERRESRERIRMAAQLAKHNPFPLWLFGTASARYPESPEKLMRDQLLEEGVCDSRIFCSSDFNAPHSFDTVEEMENVFSVAKAHKIENIICISNRLHLLQVRALAKNRGIHLVFLPTRLREWTWWYLTARMGLLSLAYLGIGKGFLPLRWVRHARQHWAGFLY